MLRMKGPSRHTTCPQEVRKHAAHAPSSACESQPEHRISTECHAVKVAGATLSVLQLLQPPVRRCTGSGSGHAFRWPRRAPGVLHMLHVLQVAAAPLQREGRHVPDDVHAAFLVPNPAPPGSSLCTANPRNSCNNVYSSAQGRPESVS